MSDIDRFQIGTPVIFREYRHLTGHVIGHRMTRVIVQTTQPLPNTMPIGTLVLDDFRVAASPNLLSKCHE